jgi:hypothetical protein
MSQSKRQRVDGVPSSIADLLAIDPKIVWSKKKFKDAS